jgi:hypothetical protein
MVASSGCQPRRQASDRARRAAPSAGRRRAGREEPVRSRCRASLRRRRARSRRGPPARRNLASSEARVAAAPGFRESWGRKAREPPVHAASANRMPVPGHIRDISQTSEKMQAQKKPRISKAFAARPDPLRCREESAGAQRTLLGSRCARIRRQRRRGCSCAMAMLVEGREADRVMRRRELPRRGRRA